LEIIQILNVENTNSPKISIIIPVKNGAGTINACLKDIYAQNLISETEVIVIDSGSTDGTLEIVKKYPVRLYQIPPEDFGHGKTRNYGVSLAKGELVVMTVQDARPSSDKWLETMQQHFDDPDIAGVCGQQAVPHEKDKNPVQWFRPISKAKYTEKYFPKGEFIKLTQEEQWQHCRWDDVNAMYRKSILEQIPFRDVEFGEDMIWAKDALSAGYKIVYDNRAMVWHYHHYTDSDKLKQRIHQTLHFTYETFAVQRQNPYNLKYFVRLVYLLIKFSVRTKWWTYNLNLFFISRKAHKSFKFED
jgi:rhamnosyltransferase